MAVSTTTAHAGSPDQKKMTLVYRTTKPTSSAIISFAMRDLSITK